MVVISRHGQITRRRHRGRERCAADEGPNNDRYAAIGGKRSELLKK